MVPLWNGGNGRQREDRQQVGICQYERECVRNRYESRTSKYDMKGCVNMKVGVRHLLMQ